MRQGRRYRAATAAEVAIGTRRATGGRMRLRTTTVASLYRLFTLATLAAFAVAAPRAAHADDRAAGQGMLAAGIIITAGSVGGAAACAALFGDSASDGLGEHYARSH